MKNKQIERIYTKTFKQLLTNPNQISYLTKLYTFGFLLMAEYNKESHQTAMLYFNVENYNFENLIDLIKKHDVSSKLISELNKELFIYFKIKNDTKHFKSIFANFHNIYLLELDTKPLNYFYAKNYDAKEDVKSIDNYAKIISTIGVLNNDIKAILTKNYAAVIEYSKLVFLQVKHHE